MKTIQIIKRASVALLFVALFSAVPACDEAEENNTEINSTELVTVDVKVDGMTCEHCEMHIKNAIMELKGISSAKLSHTDANALVEFDKSQTSEQEIKDAINGSGYKVVE